MGAVGGAAVGGKLAKKNTATPAENKKSVVMAKSVKKSKKGGKGKKGAQPQMRKENTLVRVGPGLQIPYKGGMRMSTRGIIPVVNSAAGQSNRIFLLSIGTTRTKSANLGCLFGNGANDMAYTAQYGSIAGLYRKYRIVSLSVTFRSFVTSASSGVLYVCFDDSPSMGLTGAAGIMNRAGACMQDYKRDCKLVWRPTDPGDYLPKYTVTSTEATEANLGYGSFNYFLSNDQALNASVGNFEVSAVLEFFDPIG